MFFRGIRGQKQKPRIWPVRAVAVFGLTGWESMRFSAFVGSPDLRRIFVRVCGT